MRGKDGFRDAVPGASRQICADIEEAAVCMPHAETLDPLMAHFEVELHAVHGFLDKPQVGYLGT